MVNVGGVASGSVTMVVLGLPENVVAAFPAVSVTEKLLARAKEADLAVFSTPEAVAAI